MDGPKGGILKQGISEKQPKQKGWLTMNHLENQFTTALLEQLSKAKEACGVEETRLRQQAEALGGVKAVQQMLQRRQATRQFEPLKNKKRLDLSVEALVVKGKYGSLFTDDEVNTCLDALLEAGYF